MKSKNFFAIAGFMILPFLANAQIKLGIKSGANISTIQGFYTNPLKKLGWYAGGSLIIPIGRKVSLLPELLFSSKGVCLIPTAPPQYEPTKDKLNFNYINLPLLISYGMGHLISLVIGPELGYLVSVRHKIQKNVYKSDFYYPKKFDVAIDIGVQYHVIKKCGIEARYSYGFKTMRYRDITGIYTREGGAHRIFQIGLNYEIK